jgi:hypothetical protein
MTESGIGGGFGLDQTAPVGDVSAGQNQVSPGAGEREKRRRKQEAEQNSSNHPADAAPQGDGAEHAAEQNDQPQHRIDSLA